MPFKSLEMNIPQFVMLMLPGMECPMCGCILMSGHMAGLRRKKQHTDLHLSCAKYIRVNYKTVV